MSLGPLRARSLRLSQVKAGPRPQEGHRPCRELSIYIGPRGNGATTLNRTAYIELASEPALKHREKPMRSIVLATVAILASDLALADNYTRPHVRKDGTYVPGHYSSEPNNHRFDNYSGRGNTNPYTGERGSARHEFTNPPEYNSGRTNRQPTYNTPPNSNPYGSSRSRQRY